MGCKYRIESDEKRIRLQRLNMPAEAVIDLSRVQAAVLHACFERAERQGPGDFPVETIDDLVISLNHRPTMIVINQGAVHIEIHPPGWLPIASEIALILPRMSLKDDSSNHTFAKPPSRATH